MALLGLIGSVTYYLVFIKPKRNEPEREHLLLPSLKAITSSESPPSKILDE